MDVYITRKIPQPAIDYLTDHELEVEMHDGEDALSRDALLTKSRPVRALIPLLSDAIDKELIDACPNLKIVANYAVGYNNIDVAYARSKKIVVTNTPDVLTDATADLTWALILSAAKRIVESDRFMREGKFTGWGPMLFLGGDVAGKTLGIIGAGRIGQAVGKRATGFGMRILYADTRDNSDFESATGAKRIPFERLIAESDYITFHCPLVPETRHLINGETIKKVRKGAYLINTSRGPVVDEQVLAKALSDGTLSGAGLDVYEHEPAVTEALLTMDNVVLLPHIGSGTWETRNRMGMIAAKNVVAVLNGQPPVTPV